jgi:sulfate adenylyltransferase subunit 1
MNAPTLIRDFEPDPAAGLADRGVLRFITAGSVDDGKSTLIGRLLVDARGVLGDQLSALARARVNRAGNGALDLSLLTDGLEAEREQGITIDVAYRYFATVRRKFIIADTPGHEQYTRNMVTGASTADAAVVLVDASRVAPDATGRIELLPQTRRHTALARLLGIRHVAVAVNKMDAVGFAQARFDAIVAAYRELAQRLDVPQFTPLAVSALDGDNVVTRSARMPWYDGPTLLEWLEDAPGASDDDAAAAAPLRFAVQLVLRSTADHHGGARRYAGRVGAGQVAVGDRVRLAPGGGDAQVVGIETFDGALAAAGPGRSVSLRLDRELDISRGDWLVAADAPTRSAQRLLADVAWLDTEGFDPSAPPRRLWLQHGTRSVPARVRAVAARLDLGTMQWQEVGDVGMSGALGANDIARVQIETQAPLAFDAYSDARATGAFVLVDPATHRTLAAGMIRGTAG